MWRSMVLGVLMTALVPAPSPAQTTYTLIPLDGLPAALDPSGPLVAIGSVFSPDAGHPQRAAFLTEAGPVELGPLPQGIAGQGTGLCGAYATGSGTGGLAGDTHAFLAVAGEPLLRDLSAGEPFTAGSDVNCAGTVVGLRQAASDAFAPMLWVLGQPGRALPTFQAGGLPRADAVNAADDVTGSAPRGSLNHCVLWRAATDWQVEDCGVDPAGQDFSTGFAISDDDHIVGAFFRPGQVQLGFLREPDGTIVVLAPLAEEQQSLAAAVNNAGLIVGASSTDPERAGLLGTSQCTLWQDDASLEPPAPVRLADLVTNGDTWQLRRCLGVNKDGVLLGDGLRLEGGVWTTSAFLAIPTTTVAEEPTPARRKRRERRQEEVVAWRTRWQDQRAGVLGKLERWEHQVAAWKARHGK